MPGKILGLDIDQDSITAVQVKSGLGKYELLSCARVSMEGPEGIDEAIGALLDQMDLESDFYITAIPSERASYRNLQMPFKDLKKIRQALPFEIETLVPFPIEDLVFDFVADDRSHQGEILSVSAKKSFVSEFLIRLQGRGIDPNVVDIRCVPIVSWLLSHDKAPDDGLFLELGENQVVMILFLNRQIVLIRSLFPAQGSAVRPSPTQAKDGEAGSPGHLDTEASYFETVHRMVQNTLHSFSWQTQKAAHIERIYCSGPMAFRSRTDELLTGLFDVPAEPIDVTQDKRIQVKDGDCPGWDPALMSNALALAVRSPKKGQGFNFRKGEFHLKERYSWIRKEVKRAAVFALVILSVFAVNLGTDYHLLKKKCDSLDQKAAQVFKQAFPETKRIINPVQQMKIKVNELNKSSQSRSGPHGGILDILEEISQRLSKSLEIHLSRMVIDTETVRISGRTDTFNTVDSIKSGLEPSNLFESVTISSANLDRSGKQVQFELKLERAK
ncbi:MAG: type II secretion system protein GspL [Thermodesulfobacteriota bacterium]|nr:type II secretion system protein GspL [Thermodesulfobacteriota bacterium]